MFNFRIVSVVTTGCVTLVAGSYAIADMKVEVEATNAAGYELEVKVEGTSLGFIDRTDDFPESFFGDLGGEATLTDPLGNECEVEIVRSNNGIGLPPTGFFNARLALFGASGPQLVSIRHDDSMTVLIPPVSKTQFVGCVVVPPVGPANAIVFPGERTEVEIEVEAEDG